MKTKVQACERRHIPLYGLSLKKNGDAFSEGYDADYLVGNTWYVTLSGFLFD